MTKTKHSLIMSAIALFLCASMLIGTTFAWFTDTVVSSGNKIQSGTLKLDLELLEKDNTTWTSLKDDPKALFNYDKWEPGYTDVKILKIKNEGTLALKWVAQFVSATTLSKLANVIDVYVTTAPLSAYPTDRDVVENWTKAGTVKEFVNTIEQTTNGVLYAVGSTEGASEAYLGIALKMQESANNDYQGLDLGGEFDIRIFAAQLNAETDSIDKDYDIDSKYDRAGFASKAVEENLSAYELEVYDLNSDTNAKLGTAVVPAIALANDAEEVGVTIVDSDYEANITLTADQTTKAYDVKVSGLKADNTEPVKITLFAPAGLDPTTVKTYHYDTEIDCTYDPSTGYVIFEAATFSPFTVVYDADSVYVAPEVDKDSLPVANVVQSTEYENVDLPWGSYGQWSPTEGLDSQLEAAYTFSCVDTPAEAEESKYANWYCDFYVMLDRDLGENEIFLGGNYGSFGWVGFHNGDLTLEANTEIPLLGSVTSNPWTYAQVAANVGTFICGVGDVNDALADAKFTVMLRLTNPDDESESYDVATIEHTFTKTVYTGEELQDAINNGNSNIQLGGDIDLSEGLNIPGLN